MADKEVRPFHFDLTETLYFHRNEGVSEMLGIGLDPEITIESHPDYVSIRGIIALTGEYLPVFVDDDRDVEDEEEIQARYFKRVERDEDGICDFLHHFPIDISIPHERIRQLSDLTVSVDHFDYKIPDPRKMILEATIEIGGLEYDRQVETEETLDEVIEEVIEADDEVIEEDERVEFDLKIKEEEPEPVEEEEIDVKEEKVEVEEKVLPFKPREEVKPEVNVTVDKKEEVLEEARTASFDDEFDSDDVEQEEERIEHPTYLLDLFEQPDVAEERFSQLKIYIVQNDDTLESISEKYQVNLTKLQRINRLDTTDVNQGQILYIPESIS